MLGKRLCDEVLLFFNKHFFDCYKRNDKMLLSTRTLIVHRVQKRTGSIVHTNCYNKYLNVYACMCICTYA